MYMFELGFRVKTRIVAHVDCKWKCGCEERIAILPIDIPIQHDFKVPIGINLPSLFFGPKGLAVAIAVQAGEAGYRAMPFAGQAFSAINGLYAKGPAAMCMGVDPNQAARL